MSEMQTYLPILEPVTAWQWDGRAETTEKMLKRWGKKIAYFPATPIKSLLSSKVTVMSHYLRIQREHGGVMQMVQVDEGEYIIENQWGISVFSQERFERGHQLAGPYAATYPDISRIEVIKDSQRDYVKYGFAGVQIAVQDEGRTLKIFAASKELQKLQDGTGEGES